MVAEQDETEAGEPDVAQHSPDFELGRLGGYIPRLVAGCHHLALNRDIARLPACSCCVTISPFLETQCGYYHALVQGTRAQPCTFLPRQSHIRLRRGVQALAIVRSQRTD